MVNCQKFVQKIESIDFSNSCILAETKKSLHKKVINRAFALYAIQKSRNLNLSRGQFDKNIFYRGLGGLLQFQNDAWSVCHYHQPPGHFGRQGCSHEGRFGRQGCHRHDLCHLGHFLGHLAEFDRHLMKFGGHLAKFGGHLAKFGGHRC